MYRSLQKLLEDFAEITADLGGDPSDSPRIRRLHKTTLGLHSLLPKGDTFFYSILIPVYKPNPDFFRVAAKAALLQTAPHKEVLFGYDGPQPPEVLAVIQELKRQFPEYASQIREFHFDRSEGGGISRTTNRLATEARGNFLLLMDHDDWIRPDLLFRYEQTLRLGSKLDRHVLYCNEYKIDARNAFIVSSLLKKPLAPEFPYVFINWICHCLLVPKGLWDQAGGLRPECDGAQDYDLSLRLDLLGAQFENVPFALYAWRAHQGSTAKSVTQKDYATPAGIRALTEYATQKGLNWEISEGLRPTTYRAKPALRMTKEPIHIVIPYRDQKAFTLKAVRSCLSQNSCTPLITAIDNNSTDHSIALDLESLGVEVLHAPEPFNYSRLNNRAARESRHTTHSDIILFLNNDVELEPNCIEEMLRWAHQPQIGAVGAQLWYPNRHLQHGGVDLRDDGPSHRMTWAHTDARARAETLAFSGTLRTCAAVTAACLMIQRSMFEKVGGFDEIWYPIAFSDTALCSKISRLGYRIFYSPYATAVHFESISRGYESIEDYEASSWLHRKRFP